MADTEELQAHTTVGRAPGLEHSPPPSYDDTTFTIGTRKIPRPLVSVVQLKSHLRLLGMFALMKQKVEDPSLDSQLTETMPLLAKALSPEEGWVWFLSTWRLRGISWPCMPFR